LHHLTIAQCTWLCLLVLANVGCQRRDEEIAGVNIPIPLTKNPDKSFVPVKGFEDGQVSYQGKVAPAEIFTFYQETMAAKGWQPNSWFAARKIRSPIQKLTG